MFKVHSVRTRPELKTRGLPARNTQKWLQCASSKVWSRITAPWISCALELEEGFLSLGKGRIGDCTLSCVLQAVQRPLRKKYVLVGLYGNTAGAQKQKQVIKHPLDSLALAACDRSVAGTGDALC